MLCYAKSLQSCLTLCDPIDGSPLGSPIPGILQAKTLECLFLFLFFYFSVVLTKEFSLGVCSEAG